MQSHVLIKGKQRDIGHTEEVRQHDHGGKGWTDIATRGWNVGSHQGLEEAKRGFSLGAW